MHAPKVPAPLLKEIKAEHMVDDDVSKVEFCEDAAEDALFAREDAAKDTLLAREESSQHAAAPCVSATKQKRAHVTGASGLHSVAIYGQFLLFCDQSMREKAWRSHKRGA